jgi:hypothetical protein
MEGEVRGLSQLPEDLQKAILSIDSGKFDFSGKASIMQEAAAWFLDTQQVPKAIIAFEEVRRLQRSEV